jgi:hypothetical protein
MGSPPPDQDPRPKLALTSAPDPNAQIQQVFYCFIGECFLKNSNPNYTDHERKGKNTFNFFSENWVSHAWIDFFIFNILDHACTTCFVFANAFVNPF